MLTYTEYKELKKSIYEELKKSIALFLGIDSKQIRNIVHSQDWKEDEKKVFKILITVSKKE